MRKPAVGRSSVPVLDTDGNVHYVAWMKLTRRFAPFLIEAHACHADKDLPAAAFSVMYMPIVAAAGLEGHIENADLLRGQRSKIALADKVLRKRIVGRTDGENHLIFVL